MNLRLPTLAVLAVLAGACEAGPSAFDRSGGIGAVDTTDVASLPEVPSTAAPDSDVVADVRSGSPPAAAPESPMTAFVGPGDPPDTASSGRDPDGPTADPAAARPEGSAFPRPEHVRGIYLNAWAAGSTRRSAELVDLARRTEVNAFVIDIKDATGYVSHDTSVPLAREIGATGEIRIRDLPGLLDRLRAAGVYPIARIVIVKDPLLAAARPELAIQDSAGGVWKDGKGVVWLNPYARGVWEYHVDLAREMASLGFPEIQWDYVRFPDAPRSVLGRAVFPGAEGRERADAIRDFLAYSKQELEPLGVAVTADVFGVTTSVRRDVGIGQVWESFIDQVDVALPMVYPSHYWEGSFGFDEPNARPYEIVRAALTDALRRSEAVAGAGTTRPWLQDFTLGKPRYEAPEVRAQIQATYDAGIQEWILWNPSSRYTEGALEPVGGFPTDPMMRVGGRIVAVPMRHEVLDSVARVRAAPPAGSEGAEADGQGNREATESPDSAASDTTAVPDSIGR
ncbi:MAG: putative glycoside hydrolase [Longimicrobiales bacterium]